jgi:hypothetical protein
MGEKVRSERRTSEMGKYSLQSMNLKKTLERGRKSNMIRERVKNTNTKDTR